MNTLIISKILVIAAIALCNIISFAKADTTIRSCNVEKTIAITFDDGPHKYTKDLVDYLVDEVKDDVRVTFFTVAEFHYPFAKDVEEYQLAMKKAHDNGLQIASHTWGHKIPEDKAQFREVLTKMDDFIEKVTGDRPRYFRAPKGNCAEACQANLAEWGYNLIEWDTDTNDWNVEGSGSIEQRVEDSISFLKERFSQELDSYLILMHDSQNYTVNQIAPWIIEKSGMKEKGYRFVSVAECLGDKAGMYTSGNVYESKKKLEEEKKKNETDPVVPGDNNHYLVVSSANSIFNIVSIFARCFIVAIITVFYINN